MQPNILTVLLADTLFTSMGELSGIQPPQMDWNGSDLPTAFKSFTQYCQLIFDGPLNQKEEKVKATYILLWIGEEGRKIFNSFELSDEEKQKLDVIFDKFATYVEPKSNFRIARYQLQGFRQSDDESVDSFMARCKIQAQKCRFSEAEIEDRLIEQLIIGTREPKVQEALLGKDDKLKLDKAIWCSYGGKETNARFFVADVNGPGICGLPTSCELQLVELHCGISTTQSPNPTIRDKSELQLLYPDPPRKCPIHIADDIKKELDEMVSLGVIQQVTEPTD